MKQLLLFILLVMGQGAYAQHYAIKGKVAERQSKVLPSASVFLLQTQDSAVVTFTTTNTAGLFVLKDIQKGGYIFKVTFLGYAPHFSNIVTPAQADTLDLGTIELQPVASQLPVVSITAPAKPVTVKKDTLEYHADSFRTRPNASVEQLLKNLPGLEVERDGNISVQGESVTRIFVDGKEFFGGNLQMATKNLPADAIDKVQVIDEKSEEARFSGIADGQRQKIINLTLKEDQRNLGFGKATAGLGTDNRYLAQANYNRFDKGNQLSLVGMSNNVNNQGLSTEGIMASGAAAGMGAGGASFPGAFGQQGLVNSHAGGVNVSNQITQKIYINGSYQLNNTNAHIQRDLSRQNFLPGGTASYYENSRYQNRNTGHSADISLERKDSLNSIRLNTAFTVSDANAEGNSRRRSYSEADTLVNEGERTSLAQDKGFDLNTDLFYGHRFRKKGRLLTLTNQFAIYRNNSKGHSESVTRFVQGPEEAIRQRNEQASDNLNYSLRVTYTEPLANKQYLQANYKVSNRSSDTDLEVFDIINETSWFNPEQSSRFRSGYLYQQAGLTYQLARGKYNLAVGANLQRSALSRRLQQSDDQVKQSYENILPSVKYKQQITKFTRVSIDYVTSVREPTVQQLQPVVVRYDPLNLLVGNPGLRPEYTHQGRATFSSAAPASGIFLSGTLNFNYATNPITAAVTINERQVRSTQFVNVKHNSNFSALLNLGFPVKKFNSRFNLSPYFRYGQSINLLNGVAGTIKQRSVGGNVSYTFRYEDILDVNFRTNTTLTSSKYELNRNLDQIFITTAYMVDASVQFMKYFELSSELDFRKFKNTSTGFDQQVPIVDISLSRRLLKNKKGELKLSGLNVLNRNVGATQFASLNFIEQSTQNTLGNYCLLSFTYDFNKQQSE
jgi:hypothetical protein